MARPEKHNADYFSHDAGMRNDAKVKAVRRRFKEGYSVYCMLLEVLTGSDYFSFELNELEIELMAGDFDINPDVLSEIINYCAKVKLLVIDDGRVYSGGHKKRMQPVIDNRNAVKQRFLDKKHKVDEVSKIENTQSKVKYSKVKESKEIVVEEVNAKQDFSIKNEEEIIEAEILDENFEKIEKLQISIDNPVNEEEMIAAVQLLTGHSMFVLIQKQNTLKPPEVLKLFETFYETKHVLGELKGKTKDDILKNFLFWVPKYRQATKPPKETVKNGFTNNQSGRREPSSAVSAAAKQEDRKQLTGQLNDYLRGLLQGTEPKQ